MKKIVIEIPGKFEERRFYGLFGIEGFAVREPFSDYILIKTERCNFCGDCCRGSLVPPHCPKRPDGSCAYLVQYGKKWECGLGINRPRGCCTADPVLQGIKGAKKYCSIRYKKVPLEE